MTFKNDDNFNLPLTIEDDEESKSNALRHRLTLEQKETLEREKKQQEERKQKLPDKIPSKIFLYWNKFSKWCLNRFNPKWKEFQRNHPKFQGDGGESGMDQRIPVFMYSYI